MPNPNNQYTGHHDVDDEGNEIDSNNNNESYETVLPDSVLGGINFGGGSAKICVSFDSSKF
jgi:hypothetical protein